jgi:hypothetical protein
MRTCQFCGKPLDFVEHDAEQGAPAELPPPQAAPEPPASEPPLTTPLTPAPEPSLATPLAPASEPSLATPIAASSAPDVAPDDAPPLAPEGAQAGGVSSVAPKQRAFTPVIAVLAVLAAMGFLLFIGWRVLEALPGLNPPEPPPLGGTAPPASSAAPANAATAAGLGVDVYPGASPLTDVERSDATDNTVVSQSFISSAKMDLVIDFYKTRMVGQATIYASGNGVVITFSPSVQESIQIAIAPGGSVGLTRIAISHTTVKSAN